MREFIRRTLTALVLIILVYVLAEYVPDTLFSAVLFLIISAAAIELVRLGKPRSFSWPLLIINGLLVFMTFTFHKPGLLGSLTAIGFLTGIFFLFSTTDQDKLQSFIRDFGLQFLAVVYVYIPLFFILEIRRLGPHFLFFLVMVIAIGDTAAYFFGKAWGKHKIYPVASPKKSLEGLIAAIVFAGLSGWLALEVFPIKTPIPLNLVFGSGAILGLLSQISDPIESLFKRSAGVKDSGNILPGHGGILDRLDSYILCAPAFYYLVRYLWMK